MALVFATRKQEPSSAATVSDLSGVIAISPLFKSSLKTAYLAQAFSYIWSSFPLFAPVPPEVSLASFCRVGLTRSISNIPAILG